MAAYTPTTWATGDVITATKINNLESQYGDVKTELAAASGDISVDPSNLSGNAENSDEWMGWGQSDYGAAGSPVVAIGKTLGIKMQYGTLSVTVSSANTSTNGTAVAFGTDFASAPTVIMTPNNSTAGSYYSWSANTVTASGFTPNVTAGATGTFFFFWVAIGN